jgi:hypothetical protein
MMDHNVLARLLPFYMLPTSKDKTWLVVTGYVFAALGNALYLSVLAFGAGLGLRLAVSI